MRTIFYNYYLPYKTLFSDDETIEKYDTFKEFRKEWDNDEECIIILPVQTFDMIGLDIRMVFREYGRNDNKKFLLIGTKKQIEFSLSQNDKFLQNVIKEVNLPIYESVLQDLIYDKLDILEEYIRLK